MDSEIQALRAALRAQCTCRNRPSQGLVSYARAVGVITLVHTCNWSEYSLEYYTSGV